MADIRFHLLAGAALSFGIAAQAQAREAPAAVSAPDGADAVAAAAPDATDVGPDIVVLGFGQSRQVQTVNSDDIARLTPGSSPLKAIEKLPGVNFQSADAFGAYEWAVRISLRGFNQNQLGFTLDDVPLGDMSYGNYNGLHISRAIISENVGSIDVAQGSGALGTASTSNLGGTLQFHSRAPADKFDIAASGTYGSDQTYRGYVRVDSGDLTGGGLRGFLSYGYLKTDKWKGYGEQRANQANAKLVQDLGSLGSISAFFNFSDRREQDYQDLSLDIIKRLGLRDDNIANDFATASQIARVYDNQVAAAGRTALPYPTAGLVFPAPYATVDDAYYDAGGLRRDYLTGATFDAHLTDRLDFKLTGYYHDNHGQGIWYTPYVATPGGSPISVRTTEYDIKRGGAVGHVAYTTGPNRLEVGGWYESNAFHQARRFYGLADQATASLPTLEYKSNPFATQWDVKFDTETIMYYVSDKLDLGDRLTLTGGWKGYKVTNRANPLISGGLASGEIEAKDWFLPQVGAVFKANDNAELFANFTQNMRAFVSAATAGPFSTSQAGFDAIAGQLKPERSNTYEAGGRIRAGGLQASLAGYYVDFKNRLLAFQNGAGIIGNPTVLQNVGAVQNYGVEATATYRVIRPLSLFASYAYNRSTYRDNVVNAAGVVLAATDGKTVVDSPEHMVKGEVVYDDDTFFGRIGADYMSKRYFTYLNDESVPGRLTADASVGFRFHGSRLINGVSIEGSVTNLTDKKYISTVGSNGFTASGDNQTLLAAPPRQWFVTLRRGF